MKRRDWSDTDQAAIGCTGCRACGRTRALQRAHVIGRARDRHAPQALDVVMLCDDCHRAYDAHELDLYEVLTPQERARAVATAGGPGLALRRLMGRAWVTASAQLLDYRLKELEHEGSTPPDHF